MSTIGLNGITATVYVPTSASQSTGTSATEATSTSNKTATSTSTSSSSNSAIFYSSPVLVFDPVGGAMAWQYRDTSSGDPLYQSPSTTALLYRRTAEREQSQKTVGGQVSVRG
ncbi:hypothetical protein MCP1_20192 [Candidatus Terasakiella magnetica]|nr:hypothetical protein MCP1_20192 [Candidatus Terasakiella magnetica]